MCGFGFCVSLCLFFLDVQYLCEKSAQYVCAFIIVNAQWNLHIIIQFLFFTHMMWKNNEVTFSIDIN